MATTVENSCDPLAIDSEGPLYAKVNKQRSREEKNGNAEQKSPEVDPEVDDGAPPVPPKNIDYTEVCFDGDNQNSDKPKFPQSERTEYVDIIPTGELPKNSPLDNEVPPPKATSKGNPHNYENTNPTDAPEEGDNPGEQSSDQASPPQGENQNPGGSTDSNDQPSDAGPSTGEAGTEDNQQPAASEKAEGGEATDSSETKEEPSASTSGESEVKPDDSEKEAQKEGSEVETEAQKEGSEVETEAQKEGSGVETEARKEGSEVETDLEARKEGSEAEGGESDATPKEEHKDAAKTTEETEAKPEEEGDQDTGRQPSEDSKPGEVPFRVKLALVLEDETYDQEKGLCVKQGDKIKVLDTVDDKCLCVLKDASEDPSNRFWLPSKILTLDEETTSEVAPPKKPPRLASENSSTDEPDSARSPEDKPGVNISTQTSKKVAATSSEQLSKQPWFVGVLSRVDSEKMLLEHGEQKDFIVRESTQRVGGFTLSVRYNDRVRHFQIETTTSKRYYIGRHNFKDLNKVVAYYRSHPLFYDGEKNAVSLGKPIKMPPV